MAERLIRSASLAKLFKLDGRTFEKWREYGLLQGTRINGSYHFSASIVDQLLKARSTGFSTPPTVQALVQGELTLLTPAEAGARLGRSQSRVYQLARSGKIAGIYFARNWRLSEASVNRYAALHHSNRHYLLVTTVGHVLCVASATLNRFARAGLFHPITLDGKRLYVARKEVLSLLRSRLPSWIDPDYWIEHRLASQQAPLSPKEAAQVLGVYKDEVMSMLEQHKILYITTESGARRLSPESVQKAIMGQPALSFADIGLVFGVSTQEIAAWEQKGWMACPYHTHSFTGMEYRRACIVSILRPRLTPGLTAGGWYAKRWAYKVPLISQEMAADKLGTTVGEVIVAAEAGRLLGLKLPNGLWVFTDGQVADFRVKR